MAPESFQQHLGLIKELGGTIPKVEQRTYSAPGGSYATGMPGVFNIGEPGKETKPWVVGKDLYYKPEEAQGALDEQWRALIQAIMDKGALTKSALEEMRKLSGSTPYKPGMMGVGGR